MRTTAARACHDEASMGAAVASAHPPNGLDPKVSTGVRGRSLLRGWVNKKPGRPYAGAPGGGPSTSTLYFSAAAPTFSMSSGASGGSVRDPAGSLMAR